MKDRFIGKSMNKKKIISMILVASMAVSTITFADIEQDVLNAQAKYEEYQKNIDEMTAQVIKFNSEIEKCISAIETYESDINSINAEMKNNELRVATLEEEIAKAEEVQGKRIREFHKTNGSLSYLSLLFSAEDFSDLIDRLNATTKIVSLDRELISKINADKKEVASLIEQQEENLSKLNETLSSLEKDKKELDIKKVEQEELLNNIKAEQESFGAEVLEVAEINLLSPQEATINNSQSISFLESAVYQLQLIISNQLTMDGSISYAYDLISKANDRIATLQEAEAQEQARLEAERQAQLESEKQQQSATQGSANSAPSVTPSKPNGTITGGSASSVTGNDIVNYAYQFIGAEYVWGAVGPDTFDCSGFTSYVYRHAAGIEISRTTYTQINVGTPVAYEDMQPGDLVFTYDNEHVGIYVGGGNYINAKYPGSTVRVTPVTNFYAARRVL